MSYFMHIFLIKLLGLVATLVIINASVPLLESN